MTLGQLKESLAKFDPDMDSSEVFMTWAEGSDRKFDLLVGTGYFVMPEDETAYVALVGLSEIKRRGGK